MNSLNRLIKFFHMMYARYHRPEYLEIAATLGNCTPPDFEGIWTRKVNEGCDRSGLPRIY